MLLSPPARSGVGAGTQPVPRPPYRRLL